MTTSAISTTVNAMLGCAEVTISASNGNHTLSKKTQDS
jgi:hypothetical protein